MYEEDTDVHKHPVIYYILMTRKYLSLIRRTLGLIRITDGKIKHNTHFVILPNSKISYISQFIEEKDQTTNEYDRELQALKPLLKLTDDLLSMVMINSFQNFKKKAGRNG